MVHELANLTFFIEKTSHEDIIAFVQTCTKEQTERMKSIISLVSTSLLIVSCHGFGRSPSSFTGRTSSVCSRAELTTELSCPPSRSAFRHGSNLSMPPFLKKLGLKKPETPLFGGEEETTTKQIIAEDSKTKAAVAVDEECAVPEEKELTETEKLLKQVKEAGTAGVISYALWELGFWTISVPVCVFGYRELTGHWPDFSDKEDLEKLGAEAFAFVNFARFAVPLRIGLALSTTPWIQENIVDKFKKDEPECEVPETEQK